MESTVEFLIYRVILEQDGALIQGIVNKGDIRIDDTFINVSQSDLLNEKNIVRSISPLRVLKITAYRRETPELNKGVSGQLHISGLGADMLKENEMLIG